MSDNVIDIVDRSPNLQKRRRKRSYRKFLVLLIVLLLFFVVFLYMQSSLSKLKNLTITGDDLASKEYYAKALPFKVGDSMWGLGIKKAQQKIAKEPWVKSVKIQRKWLQGVRVELEEWPAVAYAKQGDKYYHLLQNGIIYDEPIEGIPVDTPIVSGFENKEMRMALTEELAQLPPEILMLISQIKEAATDTTPDAIQLFMNDGFEVRAIIATLAEKLTYYPGMVADIPVGELGVIDLEVGSYYRSYKDAYGAYDAHLGKVIGESEEDGAEAEDPNGESEATTEEQEEQPEAQQEGEEE